MKFNPQFGKDEHYIGPGEYYASDQDIVISTLLGSCISVALYDKEKKLGGINHFMLPSPQNKEDLLFSRSAKYGIHAMELLINDILKLGGTKKLLKAKVFGGSSVINFKEKATYNIPKMNIEFIFKFLELEHIPVESYSVGGSLPRKVYFFPADAKVLMRFSKTEYESLVKRESMYSQKLMESPENAGKPILF
ncbi:MAG TPA: chemotaxis protein CheD [Treponemataceae bacterium]|nr:chemotaxis protein CheD [Treponemataceae bacterium]